MTKNKLSHIDRLVLFSTVIMTGAAVMVIELLGTRIIAPFYGTSLYVWSSLIAVTMIALALGYYLGGWFADRFPKIRLAHVLGLAALGTLLIPLLSPAILAATESFGMRAGAFCSALSLFLLPLSFLGMTGPFVIKLATCDLEGVGSTAGSVYAVSTVGSVLSTLALGFYLLPIFGTHSIIEITGLLLLALGLLLAFYERYRIGKPQFILLGLIALLSTGAFIWDTNSPARVAEGFSVGSEAESLYGWVRVVEDERAGIKLLLSDASSIGAIDIKSGRSVLGYQQLLMMLPMIQEPASLMGLPVNRDALLIGLGVGYVATQLKNKGITTDTIEIDPAVADAAQQSFGFKPTGAFLVGDGRYEIRNLNKKYDLIIHDCFTGGAEPTHLLTHEMFTQLKNLMTEHGVLALNFVGFSHGEGSEALASVSKTLSATFPYQRVFMTLPNADFSDYVFLASSKPIEFAAHNDPEQRFLNVIKSLETKAPTTGGVLLTDDFNPLEHMQIRKAEVYRKLFIERVAPELLLR